MKKILSILLCSFGVLTPLVSFCQGLQVGPPSASANKTVFIPHAQYPSTFFFSEPQILSIQLNDTGDKVAKLQQTGDTKSLVIADVATEKSIEIKTNSISKASQVFFINDQFIALEIQTETPSFDVIEISSSKLVASVSSNRYLGSTAGSAYFSKQNGTNSTIEKFDIASKKQTTAGTISGEVFGWYFSQLKGIVGVAVHSNMISKIYSVENGKLGKSLFEFSSGYYFETKGCNASGDVFYGITNFQSLTTYACAISKTGIKPLNSNIGESCTDIFVQGNDIALSTNNINAAEYQVSQNTTFQKVLTFATASYKGSSVQILDFVEKNNTVLFCVQGEITKPKYFVWQNNKAKPVSTDKFDGKNTVFIASEVVQIQTGEVAPQTGRMYLPTKAEKSSYPLVIYIAENIFLPYPNQFNPTVQHLCQSGYAVFVWNTRYSFRTKIGFSYSDLVGAFPEDIGLVQDFLKKEYALIPNNTFLVGEGLGAYLMLNASTAEKDSFTGITLNRLNFPGKEFGQDLTAARMFGEDAQSKFASLDQIKFSKDCNYLVYSNSKENQEVRLKESAKQNNIKWTEHAVENNRSITISAQELDGISNWIQHLSHIETKVFEDKPKVEVKKK
ncbi:MAG: alpha/beta hydrolase family protein [Sediminibacterium sp.]